MEHTENYQLSQWTIADRIRMEDFNADNAKIDAALAAHDGRVALLETAAPHHGNCQIYATTYVGTGELGAAHPNTLTFPRKPALVMIVSGENGRPLCMINGCPLAFLDTNGTASQNNTITWKGNTVSWYSEKHAMTQMNMKDALYYVVMFSVMD